MAAQSSGKTGCTDMEPEIDREGSAVCGMERGAHGGKLGSHADGAAGQSGMEYAGDGHVSV